MDDDNSTVLFNIFFNRVVETFQEIMNRRENYTIIDKFNTSCTNDIECQDIALFCDKTSKLCQCAGFFIRNENAGKCEFLQNNFTNWIKTNTTQEDNFWNPNQTIQSTHESYRLPWFGNCVMILCVICLIACAVYVCFGKDDKDNDNKSKVSKVLCKEQEDSHKIEISLGKY